MQLRPETFRPSRHFDPHQFFYSTVIVTQLSFYFIGFFLCLFLFRLYRD